MKINKKKHNAVNDSDSHFYISLQEEQKLVNKYAGHGIIAFTKKGQWNNKEIVSTNKIIDKYINKNYDDTKDTDSFVIHYSKKGVHIVPVDKKE